MGADIRWEGDELVARASKLHGLHADCSQIPDVVPALAVAMAAAEGESRISGAARLRIKESDRLSAMCAALSAAGACICEMEDGLLIRGGKRLCAAKIDGCNDHRHRDGDGCRLGDCGRGADVDGCGGDGEIRTGILE